MADKRGGAGGGMDGEDGQLVEEAAEDGEISGDFAGNGNGDGRLESTASDAYNSSWPIVDAFARRLGCRVDCFRGGDARSRLL